MKKINKKIYIIFIGLFTWIFWFLSFLGKREIIPLSYFSFFEGFGVIFFSLLCFLCLILKKDPFYLMTILLFFPFLFARDFPHDKPLPLIFLFPVVFFISGMIIHFIRFKITIKIHSMSIGLFFLGLACLIGGISLFKISTFLNIFAILLGIALIFCILFGDYQKEDFTNIAFLMCMLGVYLCFQIIAYYPCVGLINLTKKVLNVGWGVGNNIAMLMLMCIPFTFYLGIYNRSLKNLIVYESIAFIQIFATIFTYSRGCLGILFLFCIFLFVFTFIYYRKNRLHICIFLIIFFFSCTLFTLAILLLNNQIPDFLSSLKKNLIENIHFENLNSRDVIYQYYMQQWKLKPIFGWGFFYPRESLYRWGHSTIIHTFYTLGVVGVLAISYHLFEKYYAVLKKMNLIKMIIFFSFFLPGIYGMFDLTYYYMYFMFPFLINVFLLDPYFEPSPLYIKWIKKIKEDKKLPLDE